MTNKEQILSVAQAYHDMVAEASLVGNQKKLDVNDNDKIDAADLAALRAGAKANEAAQEPETPAAAEPQPTAEVPQAKAPEAPAPAPAAEAPDAEKQDDDEEKELDESSKKAWHATLVRHGVMSRGEFMKTWAKKGPGLSDAERAERGRAGRERVAAYVNKQKAAVTNEETISEENDIASYHKKLQGMKSDEWSKTMNKHIAKKAQTGFTRHDAEHEILRQKFGKDAHKKYTSGLKEEVMTEAMSAIVTRKNADGSYDEVGMNNRRVLGGSQSNIMKQASDFAKGPHRVELFHGNRVGHGAPHKVVHVESTVVAEKLDPNDDAGVWISDFVHSTNPKFDGKSKEERTQQALAAYYQARRDAGLKEEVMTEATAYELSKQAHALSSKAETPGDHKKAAHAHYKAATALRRHTTANAAKTGPKADAAHTNALQHEMLGDKHWGKSMVEESAIKVSIQKPMSEYERFKDDLKYHERMYGTRDYTGDKERDDRYAGMKKKLETLRAQHLASMKKESAETIDENYGFNVHATNLTTAANQASALAHSTPAEAGALKAHDAATRAHQEAADHYGVVAQHAADPQQKRVAQIHHQFHSDMATHHTMHGLNLSMDESTEQTVNENVGEDLSKTAHAASAAAQKSNKIEDYHKAQKAHEAAAEHHSKEYSAAGGLKGGYNAPHAKHAEAARLHKTLAAGAAAKASILSMKKESTEVNEAKSCEEEVGTTEADWDAHYCAQTPEMQEAITLGKNVGLRYPEAYKVARNVVRKEGTEEPRAQGEKDFKNMHDDNIEISSDPAASGSVTGADKVTQAEKPSTPNNPPVMDVKSLKSVAEAYVNMLNKG